MAFFPVSYHYRRNWLAPSVRGHEEWTSRWRCRVRSSSRGYGGAWVGC